MFGEFGENSCDNIEMSKLESLIYKAFVNECNYTSIKEGFNGFHFIGKATIADKQTYFFN